MDDEDRGTHVAIMLGAPEAARGWKQRLTQALAEYLVWLEAPDPGGAQMVSLGSHRTFFGHAWLLDRDEAAARYPDSPWLEHRSACPFLRELEPIGFVEWYEFDEGDRWSWLLPLIREGKGLIATRDGSHARAAVCTRRFPIATNLGKFGFEDGDVLLTREFDALADYRRCSANAIRRALEDHCFELAVGGPESTCHNVFRSYPPLRTSNGELIEDEREILRRLADLQVELWIYDFELAADRALFP
ncbi:MAG: hypothetical protein R6X02_26080 [Enhygromyxa sp.]